MIGHFPNFFTIGGFINGFRHVARLAGIATVARILVLANGALHRRALRLRKLKLVATAARRTRRQPGVHGDGMGKPAAGVTADDLPIAYVARDAPHPNRPRRRRGGLFGVRLRHVTAAAEGLRLKCIGAEEQRVAPRLLVERRPPLARDDGVARLALGVLGPAIVATGTLLWRRPRQRCRRFPRGRCDATRSEQRHDMPIRSPHDRRQRNVTAPPSQQLPLRQLRLGHNKWCTPK